MIQIQPDSTMQQHFVSIALPIIGAFIAKELSSWLRDLRREKREKAERGKKDNELAILLRNYRLHDHPEPEGVLHAENIRYAREG
jgi:hypothetical protein